MTLGINKLGFSEPDEKNFRKAIIHAYGLILVTGPTGSGKSTTLYTALQELNKDTVNIITVEDPVEYQIEGINQVQVRSNIGMTFAAVYVQFCVKTQILLWLGKFVIPKQQKLLYAQL